MLLPPSTTNPKIPFVDTIVKDPHMSQVKRSDGSDSNSNVQTPDGQGLSLFIVGTL